MRYVVTAEQMRALDAATIEGMGLPGVVLMENAGRCVVDVLFAELAGRLPAMTGAGAHVAVVCGSGNNGGDGYVIARCLRDRRVPAVVYLAAAESSVRGDARLHYDVYCRMGGPVVHIADDAGLAAHGAAMAGAPVVIDALFGTGLARPVEGHYRRVIELINQCPGIRVAVDIPSGLSADTGQVLGVAVHAHHTVTMAFLKVGLAVAPGFVQAGAVHVAEIGIPEALAGDRGVRTFWVERDDVAPLLPRPSLLEHKNRRGHVLAVAGSPGKRGAGRLVARAAMRSGAGLVTLASPWPAGEPSAPDPVMTARLDLDVPDGLPDVAPDAAGIAETLRALARGKQVVAMGPGMPTTPAGRQLVHAALAELSVPLVLDADALNHLGTDLERVVAARAPVVMTPHPGEAGRLLGWSTADIERDRVAAVRRLAEKTRAVVVLKGARTLVCDGGAAGEHVWVNSTGGPALATAGSGDVLTGVIAALLAQGLDAPEAARLGVYVHGRAGELAAAHLGDRSVTASDLIETLPAALAELHGAP